MDNPEILSTSSTRDTGQKYVRENRRINQEWTVQRNWRHWVQDECKRMCIIQYIPDKITEQIGSINFYFPFQIIY